MTNFPRQIPAFRFKPLILVVGMPDASASFSPTDRAMPASLPKKPAHACTLALRQTPSWPGSAFSVAEYGARPRRERPQSFFYAHENAYRSILLFTAGHNEVAHGGVQEKAGPRGPTRPVTPAWTHADSSGHGGDVDEESLRVFYWSIVARRLPDIFMRTWGASHGFYRSFQILDLRPLPNKPLRPNRSVPAHASAGGSPLL
ncbi:hypothetical protein CAUPRSCDRAFT_11117 [Caulochytrium protostelioides]|uniref:Uncharacterized protein n=1 Tax=Caulochytrium protostelioides TaxID=1555241 RepID=A0A4P9WWV0_9FUNG|nr:hypothetical protein CAUPRSCDRAFT_11117 [Caulochytrium protostelioides]